MITEAKRHKLFTLLEGAIGPEGADIMMEIVEPLAGGELATKADITELRADTKADIAELRADTKADITELRFDVNRLGLSMKAELADLKQNLSRTFASWLFLSQGVMVAIVGLLVSLR